MDMHAATAREISCRVTRTLIMYVREAKGSLGNLLDGLALDEGYLTDTNNWVSHEFLHILYGRMIAILGDENAVYNMVMASKKFESLGLLDWIARLVGNPKLLYRQAPWYNRLLKANGDVYIHESGKSWVILEDRYHVSAQKTRCDCDYTRAIITGIPTIFDMPMARVEEIECQVAPEVYGKRIWPDAPARASQGCLYRIQWEDRARPPVWKRIFQRYSVYRKAINDLLETNRMVQEKYDEVRKIALELETANRQLTESKRQLEDFMGELKASEFRYRLLADNVSDIIWTLNLETLRFTYVSPSVQAMRGYSVEEALAMSLEETLSPESLERAMRVLTEALAREGEGKGEQNLSETFEIQQGCKDGSSGWAEITASLLRNEAGKAVGVLGVTRDITERKRADMLYQATIAAEAANAAKSQFLSHMSHELRTPLNHIMGFTELILDKSFGDLNEIQEEYLTDVYNSSEHLLSLVNEILNISKIEAGKLGLRPSEFNLKRLLENSLSIIADKALQRGITMTASIEPIPETIFADELRVKQILYNLLSNAVKFTEDGGSISMSARVREGTAGEPLGREVEISVSDNGIGIHGEDTEKIFEPFIQRENPLSRKYPGTGLGLGLTKHFVEMHGGRIWVESGGPGTGAAFRFVLPCPAISPR
ncbi:MAG: PAS domain-containing sensor histidine kinase [Syntrophales bacterium]